MSYPGEHSCGKQGFDPMRGDECKACATQSDTPQRWTAPVVEPTDAGGFVTYGDYQALERRVNELTAERDEAYRERSHYHGLAAAHLVRAESAEAELAALKAPAKAVAWLHVLHRNYEELNRRVTESAVPPFWMAGNGVEIASLPLYASLPPAADADAFERCAQDAKRYQWLRSQRHMDIAGCWLVDGPTDTPEELDAAIDAALLSADTAEREHGK